ncbi:hypothetical protein Cni_G14616 [Canna indica]|uniref:DUF4378 domain-containing protein n=1 Tax=Canna indica TaxID=4628 RepID=A0AAQ3KEI1_9LILI|nr:hypothetical protein Cni_G14616 [Canna indica]
MVGIFQLFDFSQASSSRKLLALNRHNNGFEAPRNSLDFPMEAYRSFQVVHEDTRYSHHYSEKKDIHQHGVDTKKIIDDERLHSTKDQYNRPSVVARLMGMDVLPSEFKPMLNAKDLKDEQTPLIKASFISRPVKHSHSELFSHHIEEDFDQQTRMFEMSRPQPRQHPQEELLQKFKMEFEAWQASKVWERSVNLELGNELRSQRYVSTLPQDNLNKEKMSRYVDQKKNSLTTKTMEPDYPASSIRPQRYQEQDDDFRYKAIVSRLGKDDQRKDYFRSNMTNTCFAPKSDSEKNMPSSPRRIVILKPGYEINGNIDDSCLSSPVMSEKQNNMNFFLQQVKERLIKEIQGKRRLETTTRWPECEAFATERLAEPIQISHKTAGKVREVVPRDNKITVLRSKSGRTNRNEVQFSGMSSPEFVNKATSKSLSDRMKNVMKDESYIRLPLISRGKSAREKSVSSLSNKEADRLSSMHHFAKDGKKVSNWERKKALNGSKSFRHDPRHESNSESDSPRNLMRSYSAPAYGTKFGKLLLEDKNALATAHIDGNHEAFEDNLMGARKMKKDSFNIKSRVSSLRQNLTLKGKLFGRRIQLMDESAEDELSFMKAAETTPSVIMNLGFTQDNSTEVPPSPASVCSSSHDEICRPYYPSPVSPLEAHFHEDHPFLPPSEELNYNLPGTILSYELDYNRSKEPTREIKAAEDELPDLEYNAKTYVRDILVTSGLFERNHFDHALWEWDTPRKPISMLVFEEVEEKYQNNGRLERSTSLPSNNAEIDVSHRTLFDLLNEALQRVVQNSKPGSPFKKWFPAPKRLPHGNELLETLWHQIQLYIKLPEDDACPIDSMVAKDLGTPWSGMLNEDIDTVCLEIEFLIVEDLVDELVCNL